MKEGSQIREKELGDENQIPYLIQVLHTQQQNHLHNIDPIDCHSIDLPS